MRVAIVHDWLVGGGAELVVEQLHQMYPNAPIYTSYSTPAWRKQLDGKVVTGWLQPLGRFRKFIPFLRILWFTRLKFDDYDLVISSSGAEAKGIKVPSGTVHINYCHAPTHYYWSRYDEYMKRPGFPRGFNWVARLGLVLLVRPLRNWDYKAAQRPDYIIANSTHIAAEVKKYYKRDATVIFPPVDTARFASDVPTDQRHGFVVVGRQTPYKRVDLAVAAAGELDVPLVVIGNGPDHARLTRLAGRKVTFLTRVSNDELVQHVATARAFLFPGLDDFGIAPVEALAAGTAVVAYKAGGALDYVTNKTGVLFAPQTTEALVAALQNFETKRFNPATVANFAQQFSIQTFREHMQKFIDTACA